MKSTKVFVYGTLKRGGALHDVLEDSLYLGEAVVSDAVLHAVERAWFPAITMDDEDAGCEVEGELYEVTTETLSRLDQVEGEGFLYNRVWVETDSSGAFTYVWAQSRDQLVTLTTNNWEVN